MSILKSLYLNLHLEIISPDEIIFDGDVRLVQVPGSTGRFAVLRDHAPIVSILEKGKIKVVDQNGDLKYFDTTGGVIQVISNRITILTENNPVPVT